MLKTIKLLAILVALVYSNFQSFRAGVGVNQNPVAMSAAKLLGMTSQEDKRTGFLPW